MKMINKTVCIILAAMSVLLLLSGCSKAAKPFTVEIAKIKKSGNVILAAKFDELKANGIEIGDIVTVKIADREYALPVGTSYTDVDAGCMIMRYDPEDDDITLAINMGSFAQETGIGEKRTIEEDPGYEWDQSVTEVAVALKEKRGYLDEYNARNLERTNEREDYADLSDEDFANFRAVAVSGMREGVLYRSSSPIDPDLGRNEFAMQAMEKAGIRSVINLGDPADGMNEFDAFPGSYYSDCTIANIEMSYDFASAEFGEKVRECVLFIIGNDGPYLIHCKEGKDRSGILCAILECFVGADYDEVAADYMLTYRNFYHVGPDDATYAIILRNNLIKTLSALFGTYDLETADMKEAAAEYLLSIGLSREQLDALTARLGK